MMLNLLPFVFLGVATFFALRERWSQVFLFATIGIFLLTPLGNDILNIPLNGNETNTTIGTMLGTIGINNQTSPCPQGYIYNRDTSQCLMNLATQALNTTHTYNIYSKTYELYGGK